MIIFMLLLLPVEAGELTKVSRLPVQQTKLGMAPNCITGDLSKWKCNSSPPVYKDKNEDLGNDRSPYYKFRSLHRRIQRDAKMKSIKEHDQQSPYSNPENFSTTPRSVRASDTTQTLHAETGMNRRKNNSFPVVGGSGNRSSSEKGSKYIYNPLYPLSNTSYSAYGIMFLSLIMFAVGIVGNLAVMCIVLHNYYMKSAWNCFLAGLSFWDFLVLFFCLPVVVFNEITKTRLLGDLSCKVVPYLEVSAQGVSTFSLCALAIDRFHAATSMQPKAQQLEQCQSILGKLAVVWVGSMVLALPELLLWQLSQDTSAPLGGLEDSCTMRPSPSLPESVYSLALTYHDARMWWHFGCYFCLPVLFTLSCQLVTRHVAGGDSGPSLPTSLKHVERHGGRRLDSVVTALALAYAACTLPGCGCNAVLAYGSTHMPHAARSLLALIGHFLLFARASATPMLLLCLCRPLSRAFMYCCCCCCEGCLSEGASSAPPTPSTPSTASSNASTEGSQPKGPAEPSPPILLKIRRSPSEMAIGTPC